MERVGNTPGKIVHSTEVGERMVVTRVKIERDAYNEARRALEKVGLADLLPEPGSCIPAVDVESRLEGGLELLLLDLLKATSDFTIATLAFLIAAFHKATRDAALNAGADAFICVDYVGGGARRETSS